MANHESKKHVELFDQMLQSTLKVVAVLLFIICISLLVLGIFDVVRGWAIMLDGVIDPLEEMPSIVIITGLGSIVIGMAVLDLTKSILDEEIAERRIKNAQERARDFLTRFLAVIIFAISAEVFVKLAQANLSINPNILADTAMVGIAVGAMLAGLGIYLKFTGPEAKCRSKPASEERLGCPPLHP